MQTFAQYSPFGVLARPLGALFRANMRDKKGRKWTLSVTILIVSDVTFLIGCLPVYETIGIGAVVLLLLLRMTQNFSVSGEYAGASTFVAEYALPSTAASTCRWCRQARRGACWRQRCSQPSCS